MTFTDNVIPKSGVQILLSEYPIVSKSSVFKGLKEFVLESVRCHLNERKGEQTIGIVGRA
jgi:hypothetical protein